MMNLNELELYINRRLEECRSQLSQVHSLEQCQIIMNTMEYLESVNELLFENWNEEKRSKRIKRNFYFQKYMQKVRKLDRQSIAFFHENKEQYFELLYPYYDMLASFDEKKGNRYQSRPLRNEEIVAVLNDFFSNYDEKLQKLAKRKSVDFFVVDENPEFFEFDGGSMLDFQTKESYLVVLNDQISMGTLTSFNHEVMHIYDFERGDLNGSSLINYLYYGIYREVVSSFLEDQFLKFLAKNPMYSKDAWHLEKNNLILLKQNAALYMVYLFENPSLFSSLGEVSLIAEAMTDFFQYSLGPILGFALSDVYSSSRKEGERMLNHFFQLRSLNDLSVPSMLGLKEEELLSSFQRRLDNHQELGRKIYQKSFPKQD